MSFRGLVSGFKFKQLLNGLKPVSIFVWRNKGKKTVLKSLHPFGNGYLEMGIFHFLFPKCRYRTGIGVGLLLRCPNNLRRSKLAQGICSQGEFRTIWPGCPGARKFSGNSRSLPWRNDKTERRGDGLLAREMAVNVVSDKRGASAKTVQVESHGRTCSEMAETQPVFDRIKARTSFGFAEAPPSRPCPSKGDRLTWRSTQSGLWLCTRLAVYLKRCFR